MIEFPNLFSRKIFGTIRLTSRTSQVIKVNLLNYYVKMVKHQMKTHLQFKKYSKLLDIYHKKIVYRPSAKEEQNSYKPGFIASI